MKTLNNNELKEIKGGGISASLALGIALGITFIIGVIDGIVRPLKCN